MDIKKREWAVNPPREPMTSLAALVRDFKWRFPRERRDMVVEWCKKAPTLEEAIARACLSRGEDGKTHNHQSRVPVRTREHFGDRIAKHWDDRVAYAMGLAETMGSDRFDALHDALGRLAPPGIGPVTLYDIATRIGAYREVSAEPSSVYLHAGVRLGWLALVPVRAKWLRRQRVERAELPKELRRMPADEVEDFVCTYRDVFGELKDRGKWPKRDSVAT